MYRFPAVPLDKSSGTFSSLDVDAVDYLKYPSMAKVGKNAYNIGGSNGQFWNCRDNF